MIKAIFTTLLLGLTLAASLGAARLNPEAHYQEIAAKKYNGQTEVTMPDGTRCDIVTDTHAIEVDFADKWAEAIGQSLNYSFQLNKKAGILLILEKPVDERHLIRVESIIKHYELQIDVLSFGFLVELLTDSSSSRNLAWNSHSVRDTEGILPTSIYLFPYPYARTFRVDP
jgi:hypothetical protein